MTKNKIKVKAKTNQVKPSNELSYEDRAFFAMLEEEKLPIPCREYIFHFSRKWRFDYCYPELKLAIEIEGGIYTNGAHGSVTGILRDVEKYTEAAILGYRILRILPSELLKWETIKKIQRAMEN